MGLGFTKPSEKGSILFGMTVNVVEATPSSERIRKPERIREENPLFLYQERRANVGRTFTASFDIQKRFSRPW